MELDLLTSADVAALLSVSPASIKRWADAGILACVRTPGRHRRFRREDVERFRSQHAAQVSAAGQDPWLERWMELLLSEASTLSVTEALLTERARHGSWWRAAEAIARVLGEVGRRWEQGTLSVLQEHAVSERLARGIARCADGMLPAPDAPHALLVAAQDDEHTLGLALVELVLRDRGLNVHWAGRKTPLDGVTELVAAGWLQLLAVSASEARQDAAALELEARALEASCRPRGVELLLGGTGAWPENLTWARRVRTFSDLNRFLDRWLD